MWDAADHPKPMTGGFTGNHQGILSVVCKRGCGLALFDDWCTLVRDENGGKVLIPAEKIGYVELNGAEQRRVGFGSL